MINDAIFSVKLSATHNRATAGYDAAIARMIEYLKVCLRMAWTSDENKKL